MSEVRPERTEWRDLKLSKRHREWGWDCPAIDIDFLMLEYDRGIAQALVEYKHEKARQQQPQHASYRALVDLGNRAGIPVFAVRYTEDWSCWWVVPLSELAKRWVPERIMMTEEEWVSLLYRIRGRNIPEVVLLKVREQNSITEQAERLARGQNSRGRLSR